MMRNDRGTEKRCRESLQRNKDYARGRVAIASSQEISKSNHVKACIERRQYERDAQQEMYSLVGTYSGRGKECCTNAICNRGELIEEDDEKNLETIRRFSERLIEGCNVD